MARVTIEDCLDSVHNRFALVVLASQRARQLGLGAEPLVETGGSNKEAVRALREVAAGRIGFDRDVSALLANWNKGAQFE